MELLGFHPVRWVFNYELRLTDAFDEMPTGEVSDDASNPGNAPAAMQVEVVIDHEAASEGGPRETSSYRELEASAVL